MRKRVYNPSYFLLNTTEAFEYSFGVRIKIIGLNLGLLSYGLY